jgi:SHS2 domain-containing protein
LRFYEFVSHTAEVGLRVEAGCLEDLFRAALEGMAEWLMPSIERVIDARAEVSVESPLPETVLVDFLADALTRSQVEKVVYFDAEFRVLEPQRVEATLLGRRVESFHDDIKAVTYHGASIRQPEPGRYESELILDI